MFLLDELYNLNHPPWEAEDSEDEQPAVQSHVSR